MSGPEGSPPAPTATLAVGRKALITGGASGLGLDVAGRLAEAGAGVGVIDVDPGRLAEARTRLGAETVAIRADVRAPTQVTEAVAEVSSALGGIDTLVLSAGVIYTKSLAEVDDDDWDRTIDVNLKGAFLTIRAAAPALASSGRGRIVAISSDAGRRGFALQHAYCASKFGLIGLIESIAAELAPAGVTANCVCPVACPTTPMGEELLHLKAAASGTGREEVAARIARGNPLGRNATERDVTDAVMFLLSEQASFLTGLALDVDGGAHLGGAAVGLD